MYQFLVLVLLSIEVAAAARPGSYTELLDYVQEAPDQGETNTCLFVASTGAVELLANKIHGIKNPMPGAPYDLAESFLIHADNNGGESFFNRPVLRFNKSGAIHIQHWPFAAWNGTEINMGVWDRHPDFDHLPRMQVPKVETIKLFQIGKRWSTNVIGDEEVESIKEALWKYRSPVLVNYNDEGYWHVILIVGYDDSLPGDCYDTEAEECSDDVGSFYIRDSFGVRIEVRDYDWFRIKGNAAFVVRPKP